MLGQLANAWPLLSPPGGNGQHVLERGDPTLVIELPVEAKALFGQAPGKLVLTRQVGRAAVHAEAVGAHLRGNGSGAIEQSAEPTDAFLRGGGVPETLQRNRQLETEDRVVLLCPVERASEIVALHQEGVKIELQVLLAHAR